MPCTTPSFEAFRTWAPAVSAVVTTGGLLYAIFNNQILGWHRRPKLEIEMDSVEPYGHPSLDCFYFRFRVWNLGRSIANDVQVFATDFFRKEKAGAYEREQRFLPMNLTWAHGGETVLKGIPSRTYRFCDVAVVSKPSIARKSGAGIPSGKPYVALTTEVQPPTGNSDFGPGIYQLHLRIGASNAKSKEFKVDFDFQDYYDDKGRMFTDGLKFQPINTTR